jgi:hypothetical protein
MPARPSRSEDPTLRRLIPQESQATPAVGEPGRRTDLPDVCTRSASQTSRISLAAATGAMRSGPPAPEAAIAEKSRGPR